MKENIYNQMIKPNQSTLWTVMRREYPVCRAVTDGPASPSAPLARLGVATSVGAGPVTEAARCARVECAWARRVQSLPGGLHGKGVAVARRPLAPVAEAAFPVRGGGGRGSVVLAVVDIFDAVGHLGVLGYPDAPLGCCAVAAPVGVCGTRVSEPDMGSTTVRIKLT